MKVVFINYVNTFGSKMFLIIKIMDFENVFSTKIVHVYIIKGTNA
jgi:hypothetical protein